MQLVVSPREGLNSMGFISENFTTHEVTLRSVRPNNRVDETSSHGDRANETKFFGRSHSDGRNRVQSERDIQQCESSVTRKPS